MSGTRSIIANSVDAAPIAMLTTLTYGIHWPKEKAPDRTLKNTCTKKNSFINYNLIMSIHVFTYICDLVMFAIQFETLFFLFTPSLRKLVFSVRMCMHNCNVAVTVCNYMLQLLQSNRHQAVYQNYQMEIVWHRGGENYIYRYMCYSLESLCMIQNNIVHDQ